MDEIRIFLQSVAAAAAVVHYGVGWYGPLVTAIRRRGCQKKAREIQRWLEDLGCLSERAVREVVSDWGRHQTACKEEQLADLADLLVNLTRGARFVTTNGTLRSSYVRSERLIEQLLSRVQPCRKRGEMLSPSMNWKLERYLGQGAFGEVWMARNTENFPTPWAVKFCTHDDARQWITREKDNLAEVLKRLGDHPNIVKLHYLAVEGQEWPFVALEYVGGGSLEDWILEDPSRRPALDKHDIIRGIACGLAEAHKQGISHRDLKPANVLLTEGPGVEPKIGDFGLASVAAGTTTQSSAQMSQLMQVGTSLYLPPEAQQILTAREPAQDDVFALGVLWYQLVVEKLDRPPYDFVDRLQEHRLDSHTVRTLSRCLASPARRFKDACELLAALDDAVPGEWTVPAGLYDVQDLVREYLGSQAK